MKNNPLAIICVFFCIGIGTAKFVHIPLLLLGPIWVLLLVLSLLYLKSKAIFSVCLTAAVFLVGILHFQNNQTYPPDHISSFISNSPQDVYAQGEVTGSVEVAITSYGIRKTSFSLELSDLKIDQNWYLVQGLVKVSLYGEKKVIPGDKLLLGGSLIQPKSLRNPGGLNYRAYLANQHIFGLLRVKEQDVFKIISSVKAFSFTRGVFRLKQKLGKIIFTNLENPQAALLSAILLGERSRLAEGIKDLFLDTGTIHILAISGLHVGLIALILVVLLRFLRLQRRFVFVITILCLVFYAYLCGARPSAVRATIMAVVVLTGYLLNREANIYNSLGLAGLIILVANPQHLFSVGFQLSFISVISIVYFTPRLEKFFWGYVAGGELGHRGFLFYLIRAFSVSVAAWIGAAPLVAYHFNIVSPIAIFANLVVIPLLFLAVTTGLTFLVFASFWPALGAILAWSCWLTLLILVKTIRSFSMMPFGFFHCVSPSVFFFFGYYGVLLLVFNHKKLNLSLARLWIILALIANVLIWRPYFTATSGNLSVTVLDVGHGDAIFVEFPQGETMLIDGGPGGENDAGKWVVLPFLRNKGINTINTVILTHPDEDHVGGLVSVLENIEVDYVFDSGISKKSKSYHNYKAAAEKGAQYYHSIKRGEQIIGFADVELLVLHPANTPLEGTGADINNKSVVVKIIYNRVSFLFCGDIQKEGIAGLLRYAPLLKSTVIKVPHHGSNEGKVEDYLFQAVSPQLALISVNKNSRFGFPAPESIDRLKKLGVRIYNTAKYGAITVSTDGEDIWVSTMLQ